VVDASGSGELTLTALDEMGYARPGETTIGVNLRYATALFEIPADAAPDWKLLATHPSLPPEPFFGGMICTIEGNRWICGLGWQGDQEETPRDRESFIEFTRKLRTETCYQALKNARMSGKVAGFMFRESRHRRFGEMDAFPRGLLPVADAICRFNPVHGQGMSVAALEAEAVWNSLKTEQGTLLNYPLAFLRLADQTIATPWNMAALPDLAYPDTRGERPPNLKQSLMFGAAFMELAARDASVHKLMWEVRSLLKPYSAVTSDPGLMQRIQAVMMESAMKEPEMALAAQG
jgi:hypothetical protein